MNRTSRLNLLIAVLWRSKHGFVGWMGHLEVVKRRAGLLDGTHGMRVMVMVMLRTHLGTAVVAALPSVHAAIPPVLDGVVASSVQSSSDLGPSLANLGDHSFDQDTLLGRYWLEVQRRFQVLMIAFTALLW